MNFDSQLYAVFVRHRLGWYARERDVADMGRAKTVEDIISGEIEHVAAVIELNAKEGWSRVATSDIAIEVAQKIADAGTPVRRELLDFIEANAPQAARGLRVVDPCFPNAA